MHRSDQMALPLPKTVPWALNTTDTRQDVNESTANRIPRVTPHRPPHLPLSRTNSISISPGPLFTSGSTTCDTDQSQTYRILPIITGVLIPLSILLSIPSLTSHWYVQTDGKEAPPTPLYLIFAMSLSMVCGVLANICLVLRFAERSIKKMTLLCIILLSMNELIHILAVIVFAVTQHSIEGFAFGQSFWMTVCAMVVSATTNITLIIDYSHTKNFAKSGSGLTHKQRSLVIIIIVLLCYIAFGSLVQTFMLDITFVDSLYFSVVSIETIGFGDIRPTTTGSQIFVSFYISGGTLNLTLAIALSREALLEGVTAGFRERVKKLRAQQRSRRIRERWRAAVKWRLQSKNLPLWVVNDRVAEPRDDSRHHHHHWWMSVKQFCSLRRKKLSRMAEGLPCYAPNRKHLNLDALTLAQLEAAALEAGAPLADILPSRLETPVDNAGNGDSQPQPQPLLTHMQIGGIVSLLGQFAVAFTHSHVNEDTRIATNLDDTETSVDDKPVREKLGVPFTRTLTIQDEESFLETLKSEERSAFIARLSLAWLLFIIFWVAGGVIFMLTEGWGFGTSIYFCFISFSTVGYGDYVPLTEAGRSIFVVWSLLGVATMTILISILTEAYSKSYKSAIRTEMIKATEDRSNTSTQQRSLDSRTDSRTDTMVNTSDLESSPYLPQSPVSSQLRNVTFLSSSRNDQTCKISVPPALTGVECEVRKQSSEENMTALSLDVLRHTEILQSLLNSIEDSEIRETEAAYINQVERTIQDIVAAAKDSLGLVESTV